MTTVSWNSICSKDTENPNESDETGFIHVCDVTLSGRPLSYHDLSVIHK